MPTINAKLYPRNLFLTKDAEGRVHWFLDDPMKNKTPENEIDVASEIFSFVGTGDVANPVMVRLQCAHIMRCQPFGAEWPDRIRKGEEKKHIQDMNGARVDIIAVMNKTEFPFNGVVLSEDGAAMCVRTYNENGECSDGVADHAIVVWDDSDQRTE